jgi:hypothetical protein
VAIPIEQSAAKAELIIMLYVTAEAVTHKDYCIGLLGWITVLLCRLFEPLKQRSLQRENAVIARAGLDMLFETIEQFPALGSKKCKKGQRSFL